MVSRIQERGTLRKENGAAGGPTRTLSPVLLPEPEGEGPVSPLLFLAVPQEPGLRTRLDRLLRDKRHTALTRAAAQGGFLHRVCYTITKAELDRILMESWPEDAAVAPAAQPAVMEILS